MVEGVPIIQPLAGRVVVRGVTADHRRVSHPGGAGHPIRRPVRQQDRQDRSPEREPQQAPARDVAIGLRHGTERDLSLIGVAWGKHGSILPVPAG